MYTCSESYGCNIDVSVAIISTSRLRSLLLDLDVSQILLDQLTNLPGTFIGVKQTYKLLG